MRIIDLRSDTVTRPSAAMRRAMAAAEVGDDFYRDDPTVAALEEKAAELLGKPAAMLVLSGTMGNLVGLLAATSPGEAVLLADNSHIYMNEAGGLASVAGLMPVLVSDPHGLHRPEQVTERRRTASVLAAPLSLVCIENTHNAGGGYCLDSRRTEAICDAAHADGLKVHLDGARIFNAAVALNTPVSMLVRWADSVTFCLSKGLGCPVGSLLAGSEDFIAVARHRRQMLGGGMRQAGVFAAAGLVALDGMIERLAEDHANARRLAERLVDLGFTLAFEVMTNMVFAEAPSGLTAADLVASLKERGVLINPPRGERLRFVTHADVSATDMEDGLDRIAAAVAELTTMQPSHRRAAG
jgi:threonine aldolase